MKCAICHSVAIPGILPVIGKHLPLSILPPLADEWWFVVAPHVCPRCVETQMQWCMRHPAIVAIDACTGEAVTKRHKPQTWHIPVFHVAQLYGAMLLGGSRRVTEFVSLWCAERDRVRGGTARQRKPKQARQRTTKKGKT